MRIMIVVGALLAAVLCAPRDARADDTQDLALCINLAMLTGRDSPPAERLEGCNRAIKAHAAKPDASDFYQRAAVYSAMDRPKDALADLDTALKLSEPGDVVRGNYYLERAQVILLAGLRTADDALADANAAIEIISARGPDLSSAYASEMAFAYMWRAGAYDEKNDKARAATDFKKALSYDVEPKRREFIIMIMTALGYPPK